MDQIFRTPNFFLDTQVFVSENFQYSSEKFQSLVELIAEGKLKLYSTNITIREINSNISESLQESKKHINAIQRHGRILYNCTNPSFENIFKFKPEDIKNHLTKQLDLFLKSCSVIILDINNVSIDDIFNNYFASNPPFSKGKKKYEFPDAFNMATLEDWCKNNNQEMYIVSSDKDLISFCQSSQYLISISKIEELLDLVISEDEQLYELADNLFDKHKQEIISIVQDKFTELDFLIEDQEGDVEKITVEKTTINEKYFVEANENQLIFDIEVNIKYKADLIYNDPDFTIYDKEDGEYYTFKQIHETSNQEDEISVRIILSYSRRDTQNSNVFDLSLDIDSHIYITADNHNY